MGVSELWVEGLLLVIILGLVTVYLSSTAGRLDRLHHRIETSSAALDAALVRRAAASAEIAALLDPGSGLLLREVSHTATVVDPRDADRRAPAESALTAVLGELFDDEVDDEADVGPVEVSSATDEALAELAAACRGVSLARRFHNDAVASARQLRQRRPVRWFRLAGRTALPETVEFDDTLPPGLAAR